MDEETLTVISMKKLSISSFVCVLFLVSFSYAQAIDRGTSLKDFQSFWSVFREAVLAGNKSRVADLTQFPFQTRGILDSDPIRNHDRIMFVRLFDRLLAQDPGLSPQSETMRALVKRTKTVNGKVLNDGGATARIGTFVFQRNHGEWYFTLAYIEE